MKKFAVIGSPISHSFSPKIHSEFAKNSDLEITYDAIEVKKDNFEKRIKELAVRLKSNIVKRKLGKKK